MLLESSGSFGGSKVIWEQIDEVNYSIKVKTSFTKDGIFGEGVCPISDNELIWLTYREGDVHVLDA